MRLNTSVKTLNIFENLEYRKALRGSEIVDWEVQCATKLEEARESVLHFLVGSRRRGVSVDQFTF
jgi:hypothetical protein